MHMHIKNSIEKLVVNIFMIIHVDYQANSNDYNQPIKGKYKLLTFIIIYTGM